MSDSQPMFPERRPPLPRGLGGLPTPHAPEAFAPPADRERLAAVAQAVTGEQQDLNAARTPLGEIKSRLLKLNYGEMKELAEGVDAKPDNIWAWATGSKEKTDEHSRSTNSRDGVQASRQRRSDVASDRSEADTSS